MLFQKYRELRGLSRAEAAAELKTNRSTIFRWEEGLQAPSPRAIRQVRDWSQGAVSGDDMLAPFNQRHTPASTLAVIKGVA
jgi:transcriptional regulator with XRE-family HTH domain